MTTKDENRAAYPEMTAIMSAITGSQIGDVKTTSPQYRSAPNSHRHLPIIFPTNSSITNSRLTVGGKNYFTPSCTKICRTRCAEIGGLTFRPISL